MKDQILETKENAKKEIERTNTLQELNDVRVKFLGKKGELTAVLRGMGALPPEERPAVGTFVNEARDEIENKIALKEKELKESLDSINCKLQDIEKSNNESKDVYDKLKEIEKIINEPTTLTEFNREIFDTIVEKIIVGEVSENGEVKPNVIRFVLNTGAEYRTLLNNNRNKNVSLCTKARRNANT